MLRRTAPLVALLLAGCVRAGFSPDADGAAPDTASAPDHGVDVAGSDGPIPDVKTPDGPVTVDGPTPVDGPMKVDGPSAGATVKTFAGNGKACHVDGPATAACFYSPTGLVWDSKGGLLVADQGNDVIRRVFNGMVATVAGNGNIGDTDGPVGKAEFWEPSGIAVDSTGAIYVADSFNDKIRRIHAGQVSTFAGTGAPGLVNGALSLARFNQPMGLAVDAKDNVYVGDQGNNAIRLIQAGKVATLAGGGAPGHKDGSPAAARFYSPAGVAVDGKGGVIVADEGNDMVRRVTAVAVTTLAGSSMPGHKDGPAKTSEFFAPEGVALDTSGKIFVADTINNVIRMVHAGQVTTVAGTGKTGFADGPAKAAMFDSPTGVAVGPKGKLYVADQGNDRVRVISW